MYPVFVNLGGATFFNTNGGGRDFFVQATKENAPSGKKMNGA